MTKEQDQDNARRARAREVGLFRYGLTRHTGSLGERLQYAQPTDPTHPASFLSQKHLSWHSGQLSRNMVIAS